MDMKKLFDKMGAGIEFEDEMIRAWTHPSREDFKTPEEYAAITAIFHGMKTAAEEICGDLTDEAARRFGKDRYAYAFGCACREIEQLQKKAGISR